MKIKLEKRKSYEEEKFNEFLKEGQETIKKLLNKKRVRLNLQVEEEKNLKIKRIEEDAKIKLKRIEEDAKIKLKRIDEDIKIEEKNEIERIKEIIESEIFTQKFREKIRNNLKKDEIH